jgi:tRNA threonylcarbamoyl adenosine modification protein (Sua5/YciO/YrdC/YwlC family)
MTIGFNAISIHRLLLLCMIRAISAAFGYRSIIHHHIICHRHYRRAVAFSTVTPNDMSPPHSGETILAMSEVDDIGVTAHAEKSSAELNTIARLVPTTQSSFELCGQRLRDGKLVSFPTETVYGLGCHALDPSAVQKVFDAKERPLSDPLIVHVTKNEDALELWDASTSISRSEINNKAQRQELERKALIVLTETFFPGPLTLVARAHPSIPQILMANTGFVACRSPSHPIARALISAARVPIAAPSANKFGHVSPTLAEHVMDDLGQEDVWVLDPSLAQASTSDREGHFPVCQVGVESTVAKVEMNTQTNGRITILRHGAISSSSIREALAKNGLSEYFEVSDSVRFTSEEVSNVAPGQTIKHYSPNVPCFMVDASRQFEQSELSQEENAILSQSVIIDYGKRLSGYQQHALAYRDLSVEGDASMAASSVFETLRWSERIQGAKRVFVPDVILDDNEDALGLAVKDKLTRAASAVIVNKFT